MAKRVALEGHSDSRRWWRQRRLRLAFCAGNPELSATILDFPQTTDTAQTICEEAGFADRIAHLAGNAITTDWPAGHDGDSDVVSLERYRGR